MIQKCAIVGGTHGNEFTGVYLVNKLRSQGFSEKFPGVEIDLMIANPKAFEEGVRFIDHDLNRSFLNADLGNLDKHGYEHDRAKVLHQRIGPKHAPQYDFLIDLHTTTSNMGATVILLTLDKMNLKLAAFIKQQIKEVKILYIDAAVFGDVDDAPFLSSLVPFNIQIEVGPIANGVVREDVLNLTESVLNSAFEFVQQFNQNSLEALPTELEVFEVYGTHAFPKDADGQRCGYIHEAFQDSDFKLLKRGAPMFRCFDESVVTYEGNACYAFFINEAAYYVKDVACFLSNKKTILL